MFRLRRNRKRRKAERRRDWHFPKPLSVFGEYSFDSITPKSISQLHSVHMSGQIDDVIEGAVW